MKNRLEGSLLTATVLSALLGASPVFAQRLSFPDFTGPSAAPVRTQLVSQVCDTADCVPATRVTTGGKPDLKKAKKENVQYFVTGAVVKKGRSLTLNLAVVPVNKGKPTKKAIPMEPSGSLSAKNLQLAVDLLNNTVGTSQPPPPVERPRPEPTPPPEAKPEPTPVARPEPEPEPEAPPPAPPKPLHKPMFLAIEVGSDVVGRSLSFVQATTPNLRNYNLPLFPLPSVRLEFYPLALVRDDLLAGLGLEGGFAFAPFLKSRLATSTTSFATTAMRVDAGLRWKIAPIKSFAIAFIPFVGLRLQSFSVGAASTAELAGLPNVSTTGLRAGLGVEVPLVPDLLFVFGRFAVLPVFSAGQIISAAYFPNGSTFGLDAGAGLAVQPIALLQIRASFEFTQYGMSFKTQSTDQYIAAGATDRYLGGNLSLRLQF